MPLMMQADAHATIMVNELRASASTDKLVLALSSRRGLSDEEDSLSLPATAERPPALSEREDTRPQQLNDHSQTEQPPVPRPQPSAAEREASTRPLRNNLRLNIIRATVITTWCFSNIALLLSNRLLLSSSFQQPVFLTLCHMAASSLVPLLAMAMRTGPRPVPITRAQFGRLAVLAAVFCTSVVLGNVALKYLHVSFFQAISATTPAFVAVLALVMMSQRETRGVYLSLVPVMAGLVVATGAEPSFSMLGFAATIAATSLRALKTVLQATLLKSIEPMACLRYMALLSTFIMLVATGFLEPDVFSVLPPWRESGSFYGMLVLNCCFAFTSNLGNFLVTKYTSPLTIQVLGNALGVLGTGVSIMIFQNPVTLAGLCGYSITMAGVGIFVYEKRKSSAAMPEENQPLLSGNKGSSAVM